MKKVFLSLASFLMLMTGCKVKQTTPAEEIIGKTDVTINDGRFTPEVMWGMGKMGEATVSPDGSKIAYTVTYYDLDKNKGNAELYVMNADGTDCKQITQSAKSEFNPVWLTDSQLAFARGTDNGAQIFAIGIDGKNEKQLSKIDGGIEGFKLSPDQQKVIYTATISKEKNSEIAKLYEGLPNATGRINEDLMYRHWDEWVDAIPHIYITDFNAGEIVSGTDILEGEPFECPMRPWGGLEQVAFSPDGKNIAYTCRKKVGKEYALSTNSDIYLYNIADKSVQNISEGIMGYDQNPVFSNNGKYIIWESMEHDGYESDKQRIMLYDIESKECKDLTAELDQTCYSYAWSNDDSKIYFISPFMGTREIFVYNFAEQTFKQVTNDL
ncbi:MAG: PD40 domain-containing protein, partial [Bacteroidales bacterium]|nr:PD40 domain-containing protein [Bacteroidales bacterium]